MNKGARKLSIAKETKKLVQHTAILKSLIFTNSSGCVFQGKKELGSDIITQFHELGFMESSARKDLKNNQVPPHGVNTEFQGHKKQ